MPSLLYPLCLLLAALPGGAATVQGGAANGNVIPNGDFSQGNVGFTSDLPYIKPANNCLWGGYYTVATSFSDPQLHQLIAPEPFLAPKRQNGKEKVFFANAGGTEPLVVWASEAKCQPNTRYRISFNCISLTGYVLDGPPPHQVATKEWVPDFEISANGQPSAPLQAGCGKFAKIGMIWDSKNAKTATIRITRTKFPHGGGLIGIANIEMVPISTAAKPSDG